MDKGDWRLHRWGVWIVVQLRFHWSWTLGGAYATFSTVLFSALAYVCTGLLRAR